MSKQMTLFEEVKSNRAPKTQTMRVLDHLIRRKTITPLEAIGCYGIMRLAPRIFELRGMGHKIETNLRTDPMGKKYAQYKLV